MKPRYFQVGLGSKIGSPRDMRSNGGRLKALYDLEKWKISVLLCFMTRLNFVRRDGMIL